MDVPLLPVIVTVKVPRGAFPFTLIAIVEVVPPTVAVTGFGENETLVLDGFPLALSVTELLAPTAVTVTVSCPELPWFTVSEAGEADRLKSGGPEAMVQLTVAICVKPPLVPVTVIV